MEFKKESSAQVFSFSLTISGYLGQEQSRLVTDFNEIWGLSMKYGKVRNSKKKCFEEMKID
jgi:hypothetical protein